MFTRLGYAVILTIMAGAIAAAALVIWPLIDDDGGDGGASVGPGATGTAAAPAEATATPASEPFMPIERVIDFIRFGAVVRITAEGENLTVVFRDDWQPGPEMPQDVRVYRSAVAEGQDVTDVLEAAGIPVNVPGGIEVVFR